MCFGGRITQDEYDKKYQELKQRQYELNDKLKRIIEADENYSNTLISLLNICSRAPELFESSKVEQKRQLINFLLSNLKLRGKNLEFELKKPFDVLINLQNCKNRSEWLPQGVKFRTIFNRYHKFAVFILTLNSFFLFIYLIFSIIITESFFIYKLFNSIKD